TEMINEDLVRDPVFQLNVLLWMAKEQPADDYRIRPVFFQAGFRIIYIEQPFPLPQEISSAALGSGLSISAGPEPELILGRQHDGRALYFEAKADSFSSESSNARQARGHLLATGPAFAEVLAPLTSSLLCYVVPEDKRVMMRDCLATLAQELVGRGLEPGMVSCHGLLIDGGALRYVWDSAFENYLGTVEGNSVAILEDLEDDTDPSPLILLFSEEDCPNVAMRDFYRQAVIEQLRARLLCELHNIAADQEYKVTIDQLLSQTSDGVFQYLGRERQKRLRLLARQNLLKRIRDHARQKAWSIDLDGNELRIRWATPSEREDMLDWLEDRRVKFDTTRPPDRRMPLFDDLPESDGDEI
ncbi:MAG TPA: hypothetical protein VI756_19475, partial [Blastocatellia bacterium]